MGYETSYEGDIKLSSMEKADKLKEFILEGEDEGTDGFESHFELEGIELEGKNILIGGYGKIYDEVLEKFCLFIAKFDPDSVGEINCSGEETGDYWRVFIEGGKALIQAGYIEYSSEGRELKNKEINKKVYEITKDKSLIVEALEN